MKTLINNFQGGYIITYKTIFNNGLTFCQLQLSNTMRRLWTEHVLWTRFFILSAIFNLPDLESVTERLLQNPVDFADILRPFYGEQTALQFKRLFEDHLLIAAQLVNVAKAGNRAEIDKQRTIWYANAEDIADFLNSVNPFWTECEWKILLFDHLRMTEDEVNLILTCRYEKSITEYDAIQAEALKMADVMTCGIIRQFRIN